jgi:predicted chitinase
VIYSQPPEVYAGRVGRVVAASGGLGQAPGLRLGDQGGAVEAWQLVLAEAGHYAGRLDGAFGPVTEAATLAYQRAARLLADGVVGPATRAACAARPVGAARWSAAWLAAGVRVKRLLELPVCQLRLPEVSGTAARVAAFTAQVAHESAGLAQLEEVWGPTAQQRRYEPPGGLAAMLGNTEPGDGRRYRGRGPIQLTGRANYRRAGAALGLPLEAEPARAALLEVGLPVAAWFWAREKRLNPTADRDTEEGFREITRRINGGLNGYADRRRRWHAARAALAMP